LFEQKNRRLGLLVLDAIDKMRDRSIVEAILSSSSDYCVFGFSGFK
jgi:hypothetical protein